MLVVHHLNNSRSQRVLWLLEELDLPYEIKFYQRDPQTMLAPASLRAVHPLGKSPVVTDDGPATGGGTSTLAESGAIIEYLLAQYGRGRLIPPPGTPERLRFTYWLHYAEGSAMSPLLLSLIFRKLPQNPMPFFVKPIVRALSKKVQDGFVNPQLKTHFDYIESELAKTAWFAGPEFTAADIQMSFAMEAAEARGVIGADKPKSKDWIVRIHARPAYKKALEKGGPYELLN